MITFVRMISDNTNTNESESLLLKRFNSRDNKAYTEVYTQVYRELYYYTNSLFRNMPIEPDDIIQDIFLEIWESRNQKFDSVNKIRNYIYVAIKHRFISLYRKEKTIGKYQRDEILKNEYFVMKAVEGEFFSIIPEALKLLPVECAKTFQLFLEGYDAKEISQMLDKKESTIYNQRQKAITILRSKLTKDKLMFVLSQLIIS